MRSPANEAHAHNSASKPFLNRPYSSGTTDSECSRDELVAALSHELRNPLAPILNAVALLKMQSLPSEEARWAVAVIDRQTREMARLLDDLLDDSRWHSV